MKSFNPYEFYELGYELHRLNEFGADVKISDAAMPLWRAHRWLSRLLGNELIELSHCRYEARVLFRTIDRIGKEHFLAEDGEMDFEKDWDQTIPANAFWGLGSALSKFEHNFAAELREAATYYVPKLGAFTTQQLIDNAETHIPDDLRPFMGDIALADFRNAGRCLAFDLPTAAGFHAARAVEAVLGLYYKSFVGGGDGKRRTMSDYLEELNKIDSSKGPVPNSKTIRNLDQIREMDRNPLMHPREVLTSEDALILFSLATSALVSMLVEMRDRQEELDQFRLRLVEAEPAKDGSG